MNENVIWVCEICDRNDGVRLQKYAHWFGCSQFDKEKEPYIPQSTLTALQAKMDNLVAAANLSLDAMKKAKDNIDSFNYLNRDENIKPSSSSDLEEAIEWTEKAINASLGK